MNIAGVAGQHEGSDLPQAIRQYLIAAGPAVEHRQHDPTLKQWAVRIYDSNRDGWLTVYEAQPAVAAFREMADGDHDGRITGHEFDAALTFISAR